MGRDKQGKVNRESLVNEHQFWLCYTVIHLAFRKVSLSHRMESGVVLT